MLHERCLRLMYNDKYSSFEELMVKDKSLSIHHKNIHALAIEMFKVYNKTSPTSSRSFSDKRSRALFSKKSKRFCGSDR